MKINDYDFNICPCKLKGLTHNIRMLKELKQLDFFQQKYRAWTKDFNKILNWMVISASGWVKWSKKYGIDMILNFLY